MAEKLKLTDLFDVRFLQELQDKFSDATGMAALIVDMEHDVTRGSNFTDFCMKYTRGCTEGARRCNECDLNGGKTAKETGAPAAYFCHAGLMDFAVPIMVNGEQVGSMIGGQVLPDYPDEDKFRRTADELGINQDEYIDALKKVPIVPEKQIRAAADLMGMVISAMVEDNINSKSLKESYKEVIENTNTVNEILDSFYKTSGELNTSQHELVTEIENINGLLKEINNIVKSVSSLAEETQMISFNASIEAARAGEQGKSFTVIATEIRRLSEQSKKTVSVIQNFTANIQNSITKTGSHSRDCIKAIKNELEELDSIKEHISEIKETLDKANH
ncbi:MAG: PocR ligand-binding domain-containing protein [Firmicutes bacterium]|nr:PocR ligand-binding domain-containing protein [Bacillota bacterium]